MKCSLFTGSGTAIVTPFQNGTVDLDTLDGLIQRQLLGGTDAIIVCGTTGEAATLTAQERDDVISRCISRVGGRIPVIAGTGSNDTRVAVANAQRGEQLGADALLVVTPYYNRATQRGLLLHFRTIADAVSCPIILYNVPSRTGVNILPETVAELAEHPNIVGIKEASGDLGQVQKIRALCPVGFSIWAGNDGDTAAVCMLGGSGVISVAANLIPREIHTLTSLCLANDYAAAGALQVSYKTLFDALFCEVNPIPVKAALALMGLDSGDVRLPLCPISPENRARLHGVLEDLGLLR